jgi:threonine dehydrogenase-like Zn-dependent dehydrogenase
VDAVRDQAHAAVGASAADLVIEASGAKPAQAAALELASPGARLLYMGLSSLDPVGAALGMIQAKNLRITGSTGAPAPVWQPALRLLARTGVDLSRIVSSVRPFSDCAAAVAAARDAAAETKVMLAPATATSGDRDHDSEYANERRDRR